MHNSEVAIIIPVYNEEKVIEGVVNNALKQYRNVICVDDGSRDGSIKEVKKTKAILVRHPINLGQGAALQTGIEYALLNPEAKYFVTYDADGQHDLKDVATMLQVIKKNNVDIVLGSRFLGSAENISWLKRVVLKLAIIFSNKTSGLKLTDTHNGLRVFNRRTAEALNITMPDMAHASEIVDRIATKKLSHMEVPVTIRYTDYSRAKGQSVMNAINISFDMLLHKVTKKK